MKKAAKTPNEQYYDALGKKRPKRHDWAPEGWCWGCGLTREELQGELECMGGRPIAVTDYTQMLQHWCTECGYFVVRPKTEAEYECPRCGEKQTAGRKDEGWRHR